MTLIDTAGLREASGEIEIEGMARTRARAGMADLVLWLVDASSPHEGDTLVVETTNIQRTEGEPGVQGADEIEVRASNGRTDDTIRIIERFTRVDDDTLDYQFTIEDPSRWTRGFSGDFPFVKTDGDLYEYACHEGNYSMPNILAGERNLESSASAK